MQTPDRGRQRGKRGTRRGILLLACLLLSSLLAMEAAAQNLVCTDCHNPNGIPPPHDEGCRDTSCLYSCHAKDLDKVKHLSGPGTPITADRTATCNACHNAPFAGVYHPYRINVSATSPTDPGTVDLDQSCGQCHGGGTARDAQHQPRPPALYRTKAQLAPVATGMHDFAGVTYPVTFTATPSGLTVGVRALVDCGGTCPILTYDWDWGDGSQDLGATERESHLYGAAGTYSIAVTVRLSGLRAGFAARSVAVTAPDLPPTAAAACTWNPNTWTLTVVDASTDTDASPVASVLIDWGDFSLRTVGTPGGTFPHTYLTPGTYTATLTAIDTALKMSPSPYACAPATVGYFTISGAVFRSNGTTPISSATVQVKKGATIVKTVYTAVSGAFSVGSLKPGTYTLVVSRTGYSFAMPATVITVGPSSAGNRINALSP